MPVMSCSRQRRCAQFCESASRGCTRRCSAECFRRSGSTDAACASKPPTCSATLISDTAQAAKLRWIHREKWPDRVVVTHGYPCNFESRRVATNTFCSRGGSIRKVKVPRLPIQVSVVFIDPNFVVGDGLGPFSRRRAKSPTGPRHLLGCLTVGRVVGNSGAPVDDGDDSISEMTPAPVAADLEPRTFVQFDSCMGR